MLPADIGFVSDTLTEIDVDQATVSQIVSILEDNVGDLQASRPGSVAAGSLGGSDSGSLLAHHTSLAHQKIIEAMTDMVTGLKGYQTNIHSFYKDLTGSDDGAATSNTAITGKVDGITPSLAQSTQCTDSPSVSTTTCQIPNGGDS